MSSTYYFTAQSNLSQTFLKNNQLPYGLSWFFELTPEIDQMPLVDYLLHESSYEKVKCCFLTSPSLSDFSQRYSDLPSETWTPSYMLNQLSFSKTWTCTIQPLQSTATRTAFLKYPIYNPVDPSISSWCATSPTKILMLNQMSQHCVLTSSCWIQLLLLPLERTSSLHRTRVQCSHRLDCGTKFE